MNEKKKSVLKNNIYIKGINMSRNIETGDMEVDKVFTNKGIFKIHDHVNGLIDKEAFNNFYDYLISIIKPFIKKCLKQEEESDTIGE